MSATYFYCNACGRQHQWAEKFRGKVAPCKCGNKIKVPAEPVPDEDRPVNLEAVDRAYVYCPQCSRQYKWQVEAAGKTFRCRCGANIVAPRLKPGTKPASIDDPEDSDFDLFGEDIPQMKPTTPSAPPPPQPSQPKMGTPSKPKPPADDASASDSEEIDLLSGTVQDEPIDVGERSTLVDPGDAEPAPGKPATSAMEDSDEFDIGALGDSEEDLSAVAEKLGGKAPDPPATDDAEDSEIDFFSEEPAPLPIIECPGCGKKYVWKPEHAGVAAPCRCGATVRMPLEEPAPPGAEAADLNYNENEKETLMSKTSAKGGFICDGCGNMLPPNRMVCPQCGFDNEED